MNAVSVAPDVFFSAANPFSFLLLFLSLSLFPFFNLRVKMKDYTLFICVSRFSLPPWIPLDWHGQSLIIRAEKRQQ